MHGCLVGLLFLIKNPYLRELWLGMGYENGHRKTRVQDNLDYDLQIYYLLYIYTYNIV
jgi:hypothetical protein